MHTCIPILFLIPLAGALWNGVIGHRASSRSAGKVAFLASACAFGIAIYFSVAIQNSGPLEWSAEWINVGQWRLNWGFRVDGLTSVMALMVTGIGSLIHLYSIGYMAHDESQPRYFAYLNLFLAAMLILVTGSNLLVMFVGWEGVGLCSYLLIGFWFKDLKNPIAGTKAFLLNRIGDAGFLLGIFGCLQVLGTIEFEEMQKYLASSAGIDVSALGFIALFLFVGAMGKSAQLPLFVWLPDAMAGPTPVSALIHAATMVTAGVYMIVRMGFLYQVTPEVSQFVSLTGGVTALFAASIACVQTDIKKVLAYSTISQLGLMFLAAGVGNYQAGLFHVVTHAFFKACLFLGAGSIIHALSGEQDITRMGGLRRALPWTHMTFAIAVLAICGMPPFSGFFSKDAVLYSALVSSRGGVGFWILGLLISGLTAFYMTRLYLVTFFGNYRGAQHPHEGSWTLLVPLLGTAAGSVIAGIISLPHEWHLAPDWLGHLLGEVIPVFIADSGGVASRISENAAMVVATGAGLLGMATAFAVFGRGAVPGGAGTRSGVHEILWNRYWVDELYGVLFVTPFRATCGWLSGWVETGIIDRGVLAFAKWATAGGVVVCWVQNGKIQSYLILMLSGVVATIAWFAMAGGG